MQLPTAQLTEVVGQSIRPKPMGATSTLRIVSGPHSGEEFVFDTHNTLVVGRAQDAHWRMAKDAFFSRYHFRIQAHPPRCRLEDLSSSNGTRVNGNLVESVDLKHGDRIEC